MSDVIEVEVNLMASGKRKHNLERDVKKVQGEAQPSTSQSSDEKFDLMMKTMERFIDPYGSRCPSTFSTKSTFQDGGFNKP